MEFLSIITPTYNRAHTLQKLYDSLCRQTVKDFRWIIIDDGSLDDTRDLCESFAENSPFTIIYEKKDNGGKHTALNSSHKYLADELVLILDSDDYLTDDAVKEIKKCWDIYKDDPEISGVTFLKQYTDGGIIGDKFKEDIQVSDYITVRLNQNIAGDKCETLRAGILKKFPFPEIENEKFFGEGYLWVQAGLEYKSVYVNRAVYVAEYLSGGLSQSGRSLRIKNPLGGMAHALVYIDKRLSIKYRIKNIALYYCYARAARCDIKKCGKNISAPWYEKLAGKVIGRIIYYKWK